VAVTDLLSGRFTHLDLGVAHVGRVSSLSNWQSFQKFAVHVSHHRSEQVVRQRADLVGSAVIDAQRT